MAFGGQIILMPAMERPLISWACSRYRYLVGACVIHSESLVLLRLSDASSLQERGISVDITTTFETFTKLLLDNKHPQGLDVGNIKLTFNSVRGPTCVGMLIPLVIRSARTYMSSRIGVAVIFGMRTKLKSTRSFKI